MMKHAWGRRRRNSRAAQRKHAAVLALMLGTTILFWQTTNHRRRLTATFVQQQELFQTMVESDPDSLQWGDLPGYTGWARPSHTTASQYRLLDKDEHTEQLVPSGSRWTAIVAGPPPRKTHNNDEDQEALFDVRAYGPSVVAGQVVPIVKNNDNISNEAEFDAPYPTHRNLASSFSSLLQKYSPAASPSVAPTPRQSYYELRIFFPDPGVYTVEVVLAFGAAPRLSNFPLGQDTEEPLYEGYLLPNFPHVVQVIPNETNENLETLIPISTPKPFCAWDDLLETSLTSAAERGRWRVTQTPRSVPVDRQAVETETSDDKKFPLADYESGLTSTGIQMQYEYSGCQLLSLTESPPRPPPKRRWHAIFIGDSNMYRQQREWRAFFQDDTHVSSTHIRTHEGLRVRLSHIRTELQDVWRRHAAPTTDFFILFNSGLHDIAQLCSRRWVQRQSRASNNSTPTACMDDYRQLAAEFLKVVDEFPNAKLKVWQTTTAAWPKWGNFGFAWPPNKGQPLPFHASVGDTFNRIFWEQLVQHNSKKKSNRVMNVMDAYWLTLARPDHREVNDDNAIGKHLVHLGSDSYLVLRNKWVRLVQLAAADRFEGLPTQLN